MHKKAKAYSYLRFSTPEQAQGDSYRRQTEQSRKYAADNDLELDDSLSLEDMGVSGFRGKNIEDGALGRFIEAVDLGRVASGSYLLVESLDRLSRDKVLIAFEYFSGLLRRGITIVTLSDSQVYTSETINTNPGLLFISIGVMLRAHEESAIKSKRLSEVWKAKKQGAAGKKLSKSCPGWLKLSDDRTVFNVIDDRALVVKRIFEMAAEGSGKRIITKTLNAEGLKPFGRGTLWHPSYISKILLGDTAIGVYRPHKYIVSPDSRKRLRVPDGDPIKDYYPAVITEELYYRAQAARTKGKQAGRPSISNRNLLSGIALCGECGAVMHFINRGQPPKGNTYYECSVNRMGGSCSNGKHWRFDFITKTLIIALRDHGITDFVSIDDEPSKDKMKDLIHLIESNEGRLCETKVEINHVVSLMAKTGSEALIQKLDSLELEKRKTEHLISKLKAEYVELASESKQVKHRLSNITELISKWASVQSDINQLNDFNLKLSKQLRAIVSKFMFFPNSIDLPSTLSGGGVVTIGLEQAMNDGKFGSVRDVSGVRVKFSNGSTMLMRLERYRSALKTTFVVCKKEERV